MLCGFFSMCPFITEGLRIPVLFIIIGLILSMWKNRVMVSLYQRVAGVGISHWIFRVPLKNLGLRALHSIPRGTGNALKLMFFFPEEMVARQYSVTKFAAPIDYNILIYLSMDICIKFIETHYLNLFIYFFLFILYCIMQSYYICIKYGKKYCSLYDLLIGTLLHNRLLLAIATYIAFIIKTSLWIIELFDFSIMEWGVAFPLPLPLVQKWNEWECGDFVGKLVHMVMNFFNSSFGKTFLIVSILFLIIWIIIILAKKITAACLPFSKGRDTLIKLICFVLSSIILRNIWFDILPFLPSDISKLGLDILTAKYLLWDGGIASVAWSPQGGYREASYPHSRTDVVGNGQDGEWIETAQHFFNKFVYWLFPLFTLAFSTQKAKVRRQAYP